MKKKTTFTFLLMLITILSTGQKKITLEECRQLALKHNKKVKIAQENQYAVEAIKQSTKTQFYPNFSFNGGYMRMNKKIQMLSEDIFLPVVPSEVYQNGFEILDPSTNPGLVEETFVTKDFNGIPIPVEDPQTGEPLFENYAYLPKDQATLDMKNVFFGSVGFTQPIYMGGKIRNTYKMAKYGEQMMEAKKNVSESEVILETDERYWKVISLKEKVKMVKDYLKRVDTLLVDLTNLQKEGIITNNDVMKVKVKKNNIELKLLKAKNGLKLSRMALNQTVGFPLDTTFRLADSLGNVYQLNNPDKYLSTAMEQRPELNALNKGVKVAKTGEKLMLSRYLPNIGVKASYNFTNPNPYNGFKEEFGADWTVGVMVNIPIFHFGDKKHTLNAAKHYRKAAQEKLEETKELVSLEVKKAIFKYNEAIKKIEMTESSLAQAEENLEMTKDNYKEGIAKITDVLEAQSSWQEAYTNYIEAKTEFKLNETKLMKASGRIDSMVNNENN
jgi:outer membrane protein TolC